MYCRDDHVKAGIVEKIRLDTATFVPYFDVGFGGNRKVTATKECVSLIDEPDPITIPAIDNQTKAFSEFLSPEALKQLSRKNGKENLIR